MINIKPKKLDYGVLKLFNENIGEYLGRINGVNDINIISEEKTDYAYNKENEKVCSYRHDPTYTMTFNSDEPICTDEFYKILGVDNSNTPDAYDMQFIKIVQARSHKKKRINKKWLKKYGCKQILVKCKGWKLQHNTDGTIEFIK